MLATCYHVSSVVDDQLPQLLAKLENSSTERCCRTAQQILSYLEQTENKTVSEGYQLM